MKKTSRVQIQINLYKNNINRRSYNENAKGYIGILP